MFQSFLFSQNKENGLISKPYKTLSGSDYYKYYFELNPVDSSAFKYHVRIPVTSMVFDFWGNDSLQMQGQVVTYIYQNKNKYNRKGLKVAELESNILFEKMVLPDSLVQSYMKYFYASNVLKISLDTLEKQKNTGYKYFDCNTVVFYVKNDAVYNKYSMICPQAKNDTILYKDIFLNNHITLLDIFPYNAYFYYFNQKWPIEYEYTDGYLNYAKVVYSKSYKRKLKRDYKKEQKNNSK